MPVYEPRLDAFKVLCFLDDSNVDSTQNDCAVLGGIVFNRSHLDAFDEHWTDLMHRFGVEQPFHMRDLTRHGRLSRFTGCRRWCLVYEVTAAILHFKIHTVAVSLNNRQHRERFSGRLQGAMRVYRLAFMAAAVTVHKVALQQRTPFTDRIGYVLDRGTRHHGQVSATANQMRDDSANDGWHVGGVWFEDDRFSCALQAADVVAWTKRRLDSGLPMPAEFNALLQLLPQTDHAGTEVTDDILKDMNDRLDSHLADDHRK